MPGYRGRVALHGVRAQHQLNQVVRKSTDRARSLPAVRTLDATPIGPWPAPPPTSSPRARRARCQDRIKTAKDTGLTNLPLHGFTANQIWCQSVAITLDLLPWTQTLA